MLVQGYWKIRGAEYLEEIRHLPTIVKEVEVTTAREETCNSYNTSTVNLVPQMTCSHIITRVWPGQETHYAPLISALLISHNV